jgi:hypothetical protein
MKRVFVAVLTAALTLVCAGTAMAAGLSVSAPGAFSDAHPQPGSAFTARYCGAAAQPTCASIALTTVAGESGVTWGDGGARQSALTWLGASSLSTSFETPFLIGRLTHYNFPIYDAIDAVKLTYHLTASDGATSIIDSSIPVTINVDETPNDTTTGPCPYPSVTPCSDKISWTAPATSTVFPASAAGGPYVLNILGFKDSESSGAAPVSNFISQENDQNQAFLFASIGSTGTGNAANDSYSTVVDKPVTANVLTNDTTPALVSAASLQTGPAHGGVTLNSTGAFTYTPLPGYIGSDSFIYLSRYTDGTQALATVSLTVTPDSSKPTVSGVSDRSAEATGPDGASVSWPDPTATDPDDAAGAVTCDHPSGSTFALGTTTVTCSSTDTHANTGSAAFTVTVVDTTKPSITCPAGLTVEATGPSTPVSPAAATASDLVSAVSIVGPGAGTYPLGTTMVVYTATDEAGNSASCSSTITVVDTIKPVVHVPADISAEATSSAGAVVTWDAVTATDAVSAGPVTCDHHSGDTFAFGPTTVTCSSQDESGNTGTASFTVTVADTTKPIVTVPASFSVNSSTSAGAVVTYTASASDSVDGALTPTCTPASGTTFGPGVTTVTCTATDAHSNTGSASFTVTVRSVPGMLADLLLAANLPPGKSLPQKVKNAQAAYAANDIPTTCSILAAFISEVSAQSGKQLTVAQANDLLDRARAIRAALGC